MLAYTFYSADLRVRRYAEALAQRCDSVDAIALAQDQQPPIGFLRGVRIQRIQKRVIDETGPISYLLKLTSFFFKSAWRVTLDHLKSPYDIIHVHSVPDFEVFATVVPRFLGAKIILDIHDLVPEFYASKFGVSERSMVFRVLHLVERLSIAFSDHVIISNDLWQERLIERSTRKDKCTALINYPDLSIFHKQGEGKQPNGEFLLCYPGTLNWHQGLDLAIRAVGLLRDEAPKVRLLIVGDGPELPKLKSLASELGIEDRVEFRGFVPAEEIARIMSACDLGVVPKRNDGFGDEAFSTKILEFMAMEIPVVVPRTRIDQFYFTKEMVEFFEPGDPADLAAKILFLMKDPVRRTCLSAAGRKFVDENNWDDKKTIYLDLVNRLVGQKWA
jgi:glycosyltransferase involved in cell wall biosynthesis